MDFTKKKIKNPLEPPTEPQEFSVPPMKSAPMDMPKEKTSNYDESQEAIKAAVGFPSGPEMEPTEEYEEMEPEFEEPEEVHPETPPFLTPGVPGEEIPASEVDEINKKIDDLKKELDEIKNLMKTLEEVQNSIGDLKNKLADLEDKFNEFSSTISDLSDLKEEVDFTNQILKSGFPALIKVLKEKS